MRPYMRAANVTWNGISLHDVKMMDFTPAEAKIYRLRSGDILLAEASGSASEVGKPAIWRNEVEDCCFQNTLIRVRASSDLAQFLHRHFLNDALNGNFAHSSRGVGIHHLGAKALNNWQTFLPPVAEQQRIVEALDTYLSRLDAAAEGLKRVEANLKRYRASVLKAAVEGRLVPTEAELARREGRDYEPASVLLERILKERRRRWEEAELAKLKAKGKVPANDKWKAKYKEPVAPDVETLPSLPEGWCWATVDMVAEVGTGATPRRGNPLYWEDGEIPWITSASVNNRRVSEFTETVTKEALQETNLRLYPRGTIIIAMYGEGKTRGKASVLAIQTTTNQALAALELSSSTEKMRPWLLLFLELRYESMRHISAGGVQPNLNLQLIKSLVLPLPPQVEQDRVRGAVDQHLAGEAEIDRTGKLALRRIARLRQAILKWAFEGKVVDQDPNDEPASILLERIRKEREAAAPTKRKRRIKKATA